MTDSISLQPMLIIQRQSDQSKSGSQQSKEISSTPKTRDDHQPYNLLRDYDAHQQQQSQENPYYYPPRSHDSKDNDAFHQNPHKTHIRASSDSRKEFVIKVYSLSAILFLVTFGIFFFSAFMKDWRDFFQDKKLGLSGFQWICVILLFVSEFAIFWWKETIARKVPGNYVALSILIFFLCVLTELEIAWSYYILFDQFSRKSLIVIIAISAALLSIAGTLFVTAYACIIKKDITKKVNELWISFMIILFAYMIRYLTSSVNLSLFLSAVITFYYGLYLLYDTQLVMGGRKYELSFSDYMISSILIYMDMVVLFLILQAIILKKGAQGSNGSFFDIFGSL